MQQALMYCEAITVKVEACKDTPAHLRTWKGESGWAEKGAAGLCGKKGLYCTESWFTLVKPASKEQRGEDRMHEVFATGDN